MISFASFLTIVGVVLLKLYIILAINSKLIVSKYKFSDYEFTRIDNNKDKDVDMDADSKDDDDDKRNNNIMAPASIDLSVIFPAYLEQDRVIQTLQVTYDYLEKRRSKNTSFTYEMIVVDDGSSDRTSQVVIDYVKRNHLSQCIHLLRLHKNKGKGFATKQGVLRSRGKYILMADADAATEISDLEALEKSMHEIENSSGHGMTVGSRAHMVQGVTRERKWYRNILMYGWHFFVKYIAGVTDVEDTQCGFKLFTRETAKNLFLNLKIDRWCFDIDLFIIAKRLNIPIKEVPVNWTEIEGSKMNIRGMINMGIDLVLLRLYYLTGLWSVSKNPTIPSK